MYPDVAALRRRVGERRRASWPAAAAHDFCRSWRSRRRGSHAARRRNVRPRSRRRAQGRAGRRDVVALGACTGRRPGAAMRGAASFLAKSWRRGLRRRPRARSFCAATASRFRQAAAPICTVTKDRASAASSKAAFASTPTAARRHTDRAGHGTRPGPDGVFAQARGPPDAVHSRHDPAARLFGKKLDRISQ